MAQLLAMKEQLAAQASAAEPTAGVDMAAMLAELEALRAQVAQQETKQASEEITAEDIIQEFAKGEVTEV